MKTALILALTASVLISSTGCMIGQASTRIEKRPDGTLIMKFPKNYEVERIAVDAQSGIYKIEGLKADSSGVIDSAGAANAKALGKMADAVGALAPLAKSAIAP